VQPAVTRSAACNGVSNLLNEAPSEAGRHERHQAVKRGSEAETADLHPQAGSST